MSGSLTVRIEKYLDGAAINAGVPFTVRAVFEGPYRHVKRPSWTGVAPVGLPWLSPPPEWAVLHLPAGRYEVEAVLPSGELLEDEVEVFDNKARELVLRGEASPNEWRSWSLFGRSRAASAAEKASAAYGSVEEASVLPPNVRLSLGSTFDDGEEFAAASWWDWYRWLDRRAAALADDASPPGLTLSGDRFGLELDVIGGDQGSPVLVRLHDHRRSGHFDARSAYKFGGRRLFLCVSSQRGERVSTVPWPWPSEPDALPLNVPFFELQLVERNGRLITDPTLRDPSYGGVIAYLNTGNVSRANQLLDVARTALFEKWTNPLAAAAGGYVLLSTAESDELKNWPEWLANLANHFEGIPDGAILRAKWLLDHGGHGSFEEAHCLLYNACDRGVPFFSAGIAWLIDGLRRMAVKCKKCRERLHIVQGVARSMDLSQAFTCIDIPRPEERIDTLLPHL